MRCCSTLAKSTKVVSLVAPSTPAVNQRCDSRSSTQRVRWSGIGPSGPKSPKSATETRAGVRSVAGTSAATSRTAKAEAHLLAEPCRLAVGPAAMAEQPPVALQPPQQLEEVHGLGAGDGPRSHQVAIAERHRPWHILLAMQEPGAGPHEAVYGGVAREEPREQRGEAAACCARRGPTRRPRA